MPGERIFTGCNYQRDYWFRIDSTNAHAHLWYWRDPETGIRDETGGEQSGIIYAVADWSSLFT